MSKQNKKKLSKMAVEAKKQQEQERKLWEKAKAEVQPKKGPASRLVKVPQYGSDFGDDERRHWIRKLRVEQEHFSSRIEAAPNLETEERWRELLDESWGDVMRLRFRGNVWTAIGHLERLMDVDALELGEEIARIKAQNARLIASVLNMITGAKEGLTTGHVLDECCPDCGGPAEVAYD